MATFLTTFQGALAAQAQAALISVVASQPNTTVAELAELVAANPTLGATTLDALLGSGATEAPKRRGRPPGRKAASPATPATPAPRKPKAAGGARKPNVRTEAGREQFDRDLLAALKDAGGDSVSASTLREAVGGDPNQIRAALNRLIERGDVTFSGKARGTRYSLAGNPTLGATTLDTPLEDEETEAPKRRGRPPGRKSASPATPAPRKPKAGGASKPNVRTEAGREQFDQDLLAALTDAGGDSVSASTLREAVGGDPNQIRAGLNRLIERGEVTFTGKARGTRYSLAEAPARPQVRRAGGPGFFGVE